ncbi:Citrate transporter, partial [human gut metagenome]
TVTLELAQILCFDPVPMILSEVFCANLGGAATMCGDPPNIIIGTALGYTFTDFIKNTGVIIGICFVFVLIFFWLCFRKPLKASEARPPGRRRLAPLRRPPSANRKAFVADVIVFLIAVALLVTHAQTGLTVSCIGVIVACLTLLVTVFTNGGAAVKELLRGVDYKTLLFFIGLFISVAGLEQTGVLKLIAQFISNISGGSIKVVILIILLLSAVCSALIDNIPFAATMVPVVQSIAATQGIKFFLFPSINC